jgi:hypothetical protein
MRRLEANRRSPVMKPLVIMLRATEVVNRFRSCGGVAEQLLFEYSVRVQLKGRYQTGILLL